MDNLKTKKIALVGVSSDPKKYGHKIFKDLIRVNADVLGVNPKGGELFGKKIYPALKDMPFIPDLVIAVVQPAVTSQIVDECKELGIKDIWMQLGSESDEAIKKAKDYGMHVVANSCFMITHGIWSPKSR